jgi:hypothetical protein
MAMASGSNCEPSNWLLSCLLGYAHWSVSKSLCAISGNYGASDYIGLSKINKTILWSISNLLLFICHSCMNLQASRKLPKKVTSRYCTYCTLPSVWKWPATSGAMQQRSQSVPCFYSICPFNPCFLRPVATMTSLKAFMAFHPNALLAWTQKVCGKAPCWKQVTLWVWCLKASCFFRWRKQRMHL